MFEGQVAVAATVINRYYSNSAEFDTESIYAVCTQKGAFASITNVTDDMLYSVKSCMEAVEAACKGWDPTREKFQSGALYFYAYKQPLTPLGEKRRTGIEKLYIGDHAFHEEMNVPE